MEREMEWGGGVKVVDLTRTILFVILSLEAEEWRAPLVKFQLSPDFIYYQQAKSDCCVSQLVVS